MQARILQELYKSEGKEFKIQKLEPESSAKFLSEYKDQIISLLVSEVPEKLRALLISLTEVFYRLGSSSSQKLQESFANELRMLLAIALQRHKPEVSDSEPALFRCLQPAPALVAPIQASQLRILLEFARDEWQINSTEILQEHLTELGDNVHLEEINVTGILLIFGLNDFNRRHYLVSQIILNADSYIVQDLLNHLEELVNRVEFSDFMSQVVACSSPMLETRHISNVRLLINFLDRYNIGVCSILHDNINEAINKNQLEMGAFLLASAAYPSIEIENVDMVEEFIKRAYASPIARKDVLNFAANEITWLPSALVTIVANYLYGMPESESRAQVELLDDKDAPKVTQFPCVLFQSKEAKEIEAKRNAIIQAEEDVKQKFEILKNQYLTLDVSLTALLTTLENWFQAATYHVKLLNDHMQLLRPPLSLSVSKEKQQESSDLIDLLIFMSKAKQNNFVVLKTWVMKLDDEVIANKYISLINTMFTTVLQNPQCPQLLKIQIQELNKLDEHLETRKFMSPKIIKL